MLYLYVKQQQSEKRRHFHLNENEWVLVAAMEIEVQKWRNMFYYVLNIWGYCHPKAEESLWKYSKIIVFIISSYCSLISWLQRFDFSFSHSNPKHGQVSALKSQPEQQQIYCNTSLTLLWFPTQHEYGTEITAPNVTSWAETVSTFL